MKKKGHVVKNTAGNGIAQEMGIEAGDRLLQINGEEITDIFDYQYLIQDEYIEVLVEKADGEEWLLEIESRYGTTEKVQVGVGMGGGRGRGVCGGGVRGGGVR